MIILDLGLRSGGSLAFGELWTLVGWFLAMATGCDGTGILGCLATVSALDSALEFLRELEGDAVMLADRWMPARPLAT